MLEQSYILVACTPCIVYESLCRSVRPSLLFCVFKQFEGRTTDGLTGTVTHGVASKRRLAIVLVDYGGRCR